MHYRSRTEIASQILEAANGGSVTKTKIMYKAYLSYTQLKEYLGVLIENELLASDVDNMYRTTAKGLKFVDATREMDGLFQITGIEERAEKKLLQPQTLRRESDTLFRLH